MVVFSVSLFENLTFEECVAANDCSLNSDDGEGFFFAKKIQASLNCLNDVIAICFCIKNFCNISHMYDIASLLGTYPACVFLSTRLRSARVNEIYE